MYQMDESSIFWVINGQYGQNRQNKQNILKSISHGIQEVGGLISLVSAGTYL